MPFCANNGAPAGVLAPLPGGTKPAFIRATGICRIPETGGAAAYTGAKLATTFHTMPNSNALSTARVRSRTPSLERMLETWFFTVPSATPSEWAISLLL